MNSTAYFDDLRQKAKSSGKLKATARGLDELKEWLQRTTSRQDMPTGTKEAIEKAWDYRVERIHLAADPQPGVPYATRLLSYLDAYGKRLISKSSTSAGRGKKWAALRSLIASITSARQQPRPPLLYRLLNENLPRALRRAWGVPGPNAPFAEGVMEETAPKNGTKVLPKRSRLYVIGDIHGDASSASVIAKWLKGKLPKKGAKPDRRARAVFLGDYVNNGLKSIEALEEVLRLKCRCGESVVLLSGNHEFGETYATALKEFLDTHWTQWSDLSGTLTPEWKTPPGHYGHVRLDLVARYGAEAGEAVHRMFELWGRSLHLCAYHPGFGIFMCHSLGVVKPKNGQSYGLALRQAKRDTSDIRKLAFDGYESWKAESGSNHARMVNSRDITPATLRALTQGLAELGEVGAFVVGHTHYRSGDLDVSDEWGSALRRAADDTDGWLATICSSHPRSADAGHYISREFEAARREVFLDTNPKEKWQPSRHCAASSCVAVFEDTPPARRPITPKDLRPLYELL